MTENFKADSFFFSKVNKKEEDNNKKKPPGRDRGATRRELFGWAGGKREKGNYLRVPSNWR